MWRCGPTFGDDYVRPRPVLVPRSLPVCPTRYGDDWPVRSDILDIDCALDCASHTGWDLGSDGSSLRYMYLHVSYDNISLHVAAVFPTAQESSAETQASKASKASRRARVVPSVR